MNRFLRFAAVSVAALSPTFGVWAYQVTPSQGVVNLDDCPAGLSSVEIAGNFSINRLAPGYITLSRDGKTIRQIPASNKQYMYTFSGFDRTDIGDVHVTFFIEGTANTGGDYKVTVPEGFFTDMTTGQPTEAMEFNWTINQSSVTISPARNGSYTSLSEFRITLPEEVDSEPIKSYRVYGTPSMESLYDDDSFVSDIAINVAIEGNVAVLTLAEPITTPGTYILNLSEGMIKGTGINGATWNSPADQVSYRVVLDSKVGITILPAPGEYEEFAPVTSEVDGTEFNYTFLIELPEDTPITYALRAKAQLYPMNEDGSFDTSTSAVTAGSFTAVKKSSTLLALIPTAGDTQVVNPAAGRYVLYIPEAMYQTSEGRNGSYWFEYTVLPNTSVPCTVTPSVETEVESLKDITLTFAPDMEVTCQNSSYGVLTNGVAIYTLYGTVPEEQPNTVVFSLSLPLEENGTWTFTTPSTGFSVGGRAYSAQYSFVIGDQVKVESVEAFTGVCDIYTLDGLRVAAKAEDTDGLPKGLYIVVPADGSAARKVLVK